MKKMERENYVMRRKASSILLLCGDCWLAPLPTTQAQIPHQHQPAPVNKHFVVGDILENASSRAARAGAGGAEGAFSTSPPPVSLGHSSAGQPRIIISAPRTAGP